MLKIEVEERDEAVIISLNGELSAEFIKEFDGVFNKYINSKFKVIVIDLKSMPYINSFGISRMVKISRAVIDGGRDFILINMNSNIQQIFRMTTFD